MIHYMVIPCFAYQSGASIGSDKQYEIRDQTYISRY